MIFKTITDHAITNASKNKSLDFHPRVLLR
jgi:hypothetical protein